MTKHDPVTSLARTDRSDADFEGDVLPQIDMLQRAAWRMTHDWQEAEDLVQDTLERAYRFFGRFEPGTNVRAWLFKIMSNLHISGYRHRGRVAYLVSLDAADDYWLYHHVAGERPTHGDAEATVVDRLAEEGILAAVDALPPKLRAVVLLVDVAGLSYERVAMMLQISHGTVGSRLHRGRRKLRHALQEAAHADRPLAAA